MYKYTSLCWGLPGAGMYAKLLEDAAVAASSSSSKYLCLGWELLLSVCFKNYNQPLNGHTRLPFWIFASRERIAMSLQIVILSPLWNSHV